MELSKNEIKQVALEVKAEDLPVRTLKEAVLVLQRYHAESALSALKLAEYRSEDVYTNADILHHAKAAEALQEYLRLLLKK